MADETLKVLFGSNLEAVRVKEVFEVSGEEESEGDPRELFGRFRRRNVADAFAAMKRGEGRNTEVTPLPVVTNGESVYPIGNHALFMSDEEEAVAKIREAAMAKLSADERHFLGFD